MTPMRELLGKVDAALFGWYERLIFGRVARLPGGVVAVVALLFYPGLALILPLALGWSSAYLVDANIIGATVAASIVLGWFIVQMQARDRRHLVEWTTDLRFLDAAEFEYLVGELFRREGWKVAETGRQDGPDGNIDLRLAKDGGRRLVQCKRWTSWRVGVDDVRAFAGTLLAEGYRGTDGIFVTLSEFTSAAVEEAKRTGLTLVDSSELYRRVERVRRTEPCPKCRAPMLLGRSPHGWWLRCRTPGCEGKRDLGRDPGRALELLTQPPLDRPGGS